MESSWLGEEKTNPNERVRKIVNKANEVVEILRGAAKVIHKKSLKVRIHYMK
jgi:hypothetical protein